MFKLFLIDLVTLLPLVLIGGGSSLWWVVITLACGVIGLLITVPHVRAAFILARSNHLDVRRLPATAFHTLVALAAILLVLPGLASDLIAVLILVLPLAIRKRMRQDSTDYADNHYQSTTVGNKRVYDVEYASDDDEVR